MSFVSKKTLKTKILSSRQFRQSFVWEHLKRSLPFQVRTMREEREWSQQKAGEELKKPQSVISRLESPAYGKLTLQTLVDIANGFDVGLLIKFVPFSRLVKEYDDVSFTALSAKSISDPKEAAQIKAWALDEQPLTASMNAVALAGGQTALYGTLRDETPTTTIDLPARKPDVRARSVETRGTTESLFVAMNANRTT